MHFNNFKLLKKTRLVIGIDYGNKSIGIAIGQTVTLEARELTNFKASNGIPNWVEFQNLFRNWEPDALVIGMPLNMDGTINEYCARVKKFSNKLHGRFRVPTFTQDERLTTFEAKSTLKSNKRVIKSYRTSPVDSLAARIILQSWLDKNTILFKKKTTEQIY